MIVRAMALADKTLFIVGLPDLVDEEAAARGRDNPEIAEKLVLGGVTGTPRHSRWRETSPRPPARQQTDPSTHETKRRPGIAAMPSNTGAA